MGSCSEILVRKHFFGNTFSDTCFLSLGALLNAGLPKQTSPCACKCTGITLVNYREREEREGERESVREREREREGEKEGEKKDIMYFVRSLLKYFFFM